MKTRVFNLIILDESGSMTSIRQEALTGVNETIQTIRAAQKKHCEEQEHFVSLVSFNSSHVNQIWNCVPVDEVRELTENEYTPDSCTPLYDAMGQSLGELRRHVADDDKVLVTIITDGYENDSHEYDGKAIKSLVNELKGKGWVFAYIGAEHDVEKVAEELSIHNTLRFSRSSGSSRRAFEELRSSSGMMYDKIVDGFDEDLSTGFFDTKSVED